MNENGELNIVIEWTLQFDNSGYLCLVSVKIAIEGGYCKVKWDLVGHVTVVGKVGHW